MKKRIVEFWGMVGNHNLYKGDKLVIDWTKNDKGFNDGDIVALCIEEKGGMIMCWIDLPTTEETYNLISIF